MSPTPIAPAAALPPAPLPGDAGDRSGGRWALFLDVDGCLLEFADDPQAVIVPAGLRDVLGRLHQCLDGALALVSGRGVADLGRLFGNPPWPMAGLHGLELRHADGTRRDAPMDAANEERMRRDVRALAARLPAVQLEDKHHAIALHCRRAPQALPALQLAAAELVQRLPGYELQAGNLVVEFKPAGMDKGLAVTELMAAPPFAGRRPVYLGDDFTDEHAFAATNAAGGISVRVGDREPSVAHFTLSSPAAVHAWLTCVLDVLLHGNNEHHGPAGATCPTRA